VERKPRIALLIDADNASAKRIDLILNELSNFGETNIRRAYGNWTKSELAGWTAVLSENAIRPVQQFDQTKGKNASDMALVIDAMTLLYTDRPDAFAIASSDADFTPLVMHLKESGSAVYGFGDRKTPLPFQNACTRFLVLDQLQLAQSEPDAVQPSGARLRATTQDLKQDDKLVALLRRAVQSAADEDGWASVGAVGQLIGNQSSFDSRNYGYAKLSGLLKATELFETKNEGKPTLAVRDRRASKGR